jgi:predicted S18 family serine protease
MIIMAKIYKISRGDIVFIVLFVFLVGFIGGTTLSPKNIQVQQSTEPVHIEGEKVVEMGVPAVDEEGKGVMGTVLTTVRPGTGKTNVNVDNIISYPSFQQSAKDARTAAATFTKRNLSSIDIDFDVQVNASVVEGPSAGATMAASIVLALEDIKPSPNIMMTGAILENTTVVSVGAILEKATAAKGAGATIFLVPEGQGSELSSTRTRTCSQIGRLEVCRVNYQYKPVNIGQSLNITVQEVGTLADIIEVFKKNVEKPVSA